MNWYFLHPLLPPALPGAQACPRQAADSVDSRDHLLEVSQRGLDILARRDVVLDLVDERGVGDAPRVAGRDILPAGALVSIARVTGWKAGRDSAYLAAGSFPVLAMIAASVSSAHGEFWSLGSGVLRPSVGHSPR